ncbi:MAG: DUF5018 domain-containing protein, partial [Velocimicrobium sp.]
MRSKRKSYKKSISFLIIISFLLQMFQGTVAKASWVADIDNGNDNAFTVLNEDISHMVSSVVPQAVEYGGNLYLTWIEKNSSGKAQVRVCQYDGTTWTFIDGNGENGLNFDPTQDDAKDVSIAVSNGIIYVSWYEWSQSSPNGHFTHVKRYDGTPGVWTSVDGGDAYGIRSNTAVSGTTYYLAQNFVMINYQNTLYATWSERLNGSSNYNIVLAKLNGTTWETINAKINTESVGANPELAVYNSELYLSFEEGIASYTDAKVDLLVKKYSGTGVTLTDVTSGFPLEYDATIACTHQAKLDSDGSYLYAVWNEKNAAGYRQIRAKKYDGTSWTSIDGGGITGINYDITKDGFNNNAVCFGGDLYVTYRESNGTPFNQMRVKKYDPETDLWTFEDDNGLTGGIGFPYGLNLYPQENNIYVSSLAAFNSELYLFWEENGKLYVKKQDTAWNITSNTANLSNLQISEGNLYPDFDPDTKNYVVLVDNSVTAITLTPTAYEANATVMVNDVVVNSTEASGIINLEVGSNDVEIKVVSHRGVLIQKYVVKVIRYTTEGTILLTPIEDGSLYDGDNYSTDPTNYIGCDSAALCQSFEKFDYSFLQGGTITDAKFKIYLNDSISGTTTYDLYYSNNDTWDETTSTLPENAGNIEEGLTMTTSIPTKAYYTYNQPALLTAVNACTDKIITLVLDGKSTTAGYFIYNSDDATSNKPLLELTYVPLASSKKEITAFSLDGFTPAVTGTVDESAHTVTITVPYGTDVAALVPTITQNGASVSPNSNIAQDFTSPVTYTVTADDGTTQEYIVVITVAKNSSKAITGLTFTGLDPIVVGSVNEIAKNVIVNVPYGTDVTALVPTIVYTGATISPNSNVAQDFTSAVTYTVTAEDGMSQNYSVTVTVAKNPAKAITSFNFGGLTPGVAGTINETNKTVSVAVPYGTDVTALVPTILHTGASVSPNSNVAQDFTSAVTYTVTAEDGMSQNYSVTVTVAKNPAKAITSFNFGGLTPGVAGTINETNKTVSVAVPYGTDVTALVPTILHTGASVSPNSNVAQDFTNAVTYTVTAEDGMSQNYSVTVTVAKNPAKAITSFNFGGLTPGVAGTINETNKTVSVAVPYGTDVTALVPTILHTGASVSPNSNVAQDFTNAVTYTVTAEDGMSQNYSVTVTVAKNPAKAITSFNFGGLTPGVAGTINETNKTVSVAVPYGTDVTALVPTILHTGASVSPNSNVAQDFTNAVTYTVTAEDGMSQNYSVTVTVAKNPAKAITSFNFGGLTPGVAGTINETNKTVSVAVPYGTDVTALVPTILHTGASVSPNSNVAQDFTNAVTYTVTAEDGMSQNYSVTVTV